MGNRGYALWKSTQTQVIAFGREVRRRRLGLGLSIAAFAERARLSGYYVQQLENGMRDPSLEVVFALARGLSVPIGELLPDRSGFSARGLEAAQLWEGIPDELKEPILMLLRSTSTQARARGKHPAGPRKKGS